MWVLDLFAAEALVDGVWLGVLHLDVEQLMLIRYSSDKHYLEYVQLGSCGMNRWFRDWCCCRDRGCHG